MKYTYAYKTSDGARHEETMEAESREAVFASLREKGIKAIKVVAADGSKANREVRGYRLRTVVLVGVIRRYWLELPRFSPGSLGRGRSGGVGLHERETEQR